jgi:hypothetical protein
MSLRVSSVCELSVGSGLATGLITRLGVLPAVYKMHSSRLFLMGNRPEGLRRRVEGYLMMSKGVVPFTLAVESSV